MAYADKAKAREYQRGWAIRNRERMSAAVLRHYYKNRQKMLDYHRAYYVKNIEKERERKRLYDEKNRAMLNEKSRIYNKLETTKIRRTAWRIANKSKIYELARIRRGKLRQQVLNAYGTRCCCCGDDDMPFLTIDHIENGKGNPAIRSGAGSEDFYLWLRRNKFPPGYQTLCIKCNWAKGIYGECPHQTRLKEQQSHG